MTGRTPDEYDQMSLREHEIWLEEFLALHGKG